MTDRDPWGYEQCDHCHGAFHHTELEDGLCVWCRKLATEATSS
jgi:hypothetical protein